MDKQTLFIILSLQKKTLTPQYHRVCISRTHQEWQLIDKRLKELGRENLTFYLRSGIALLEKEFNENPERICASLGPRIKKQHYVTDEHFEILNRISAKVLIPEGVIVNKLIIEPLIIMPDY